MRKTQGLAMSIVLGSMGYACSGGGDRLHVPPVGDVVSSEPGDAGGHDSSITLPAADAAGGGGNREPPKGLAAYCGLYIQCGGTYFSDEADCIKRTEEWYAICAASKDALNAYGDCMVAQVTCKTWNPNGDAPGAVACGDEWSDLQNARKACK